MGMSERIKERRLLIGLTQEELAQRLGLQKSAIAKYENGRVKNIKRSIIVHMAQILECSPTYLLGFDDDTSKEASHIIEVPSYPNISPVAKRSIPVLGKIACGEPILMDEQVELYVDAAGKFQCDYILWAKGDSMIGAGIHNGDAVFIRKQPTVENGEIAAVAIGDEATLKRFYFYPEKSMMILRAENPAFQDIIKTDEELADVIVLGRAMSVQTLLK